MGASEELGTSAPQARTPNARRRSWRGRFIKNLAETPEGACVWLIWSHYWRAWHRKSSVGGACGYTDDIAEAGLFPRNMAVAYHDGDRDEPYLVSEKTPLIEAAIALHTEKLAKLRALSPTPQPSEEERR